MKISSLLLIATFVVMQSHTLAQEPLPGIKAGKVGGTGTADSGPDIILYNAVVHTMDSTLPVAQAVAIRGNLIVALGSDADIVPLQAAGTQMFDLQGRTVVPGLIDDHGHRLQEAFNSGGQEGIARAAELVAAEGYTTIHEMFAEPGLIDAVSALARENRLAVRVDCYVPYNTSWGTDLTGWNAYPYTEKKDTLLRIIGVKIFTDGGSVGSGAITTIYQGGGAVGTHGDLFKTQQEMDTAVAQVSRAGYPIAMHAIGDSAIGIGLNAFSNAFAGRGNISRSRMEHLSIMRADLADQMAALEVIASIQYTWASSGAVGMEQVYMPQVLEWIYAWRRMADRGIVIAGGNDYPFCPRTQAMQCISYLATRRVQRTDVLPQWLDGNQLTVQEGLRAMTVTNAWVAFEENVKGTITPGKLADITVLAGDPLTQDPFDVRFIDIEMTIMDGVIRHNQLGVRHTAIHNAGTFHIGIEDSGLWGTIGSGVGLEYNGRDHLYWGSMLISYDSSTVAMSIKQHDYMVSTNGWIQFDEPGSHATEEATASYEDGAPSHPGKLRIQQKTYMWQDDPLLLVRYSFTNIGLNSLRSMYLGQYMDFDIVQYAANRCSWDANNGLGFCYMYYTGDAAGPYIGLALFDSTGRNVNTSTTFAEAFSPSAENELSFSALMRGGIIESATTHDADYALLISGGPYDVDANQTIAPFDLAIVVGTSVADLRIAVQRAYERLLVVTSIQPVESGLPGVFRLSQNYPNPFNPSTKIRYSLPVNSHLVLTVSDVLGREVRMIVNESQRAGDHEAVFNAAGLTSGVYFYTLRAGNCSETKKLLLLK